MPLSDAPVPLGTKLRAGPEEREVDVEEDSPEHGARIAPALGQQVRAEPTESARPAEPLPLPRSEVCAQRWKRAHVRAETRPQLQNRGAQIELGGLSDPNGARYQAAPHPERGKGTGSLRRAARARAVSALRERRDHEYAPTVMGALERRAA